jgi:hypothetical protein
MEFGYTEEESRFLYLVATHSGYFTCQQFLRFIHGRPGKRSLTFVRKLVEQGHASARPFLRNGKVYHLFARNLYEAIGKQDEPQGKGCGRWLVIGINRVVYSNEANAGKSGSLVGEKM